MTHPRPSSPARAAQARVADLQVEYTTAENDYCRAAETAGLTLKEIESNLAAIRAAGGLP